MRKLGCAALILVLAGFVWPATAPATRTGTFTKAVATPDWTHGTFAGSITWDCSSAAPPYCDWLPYISVQPSLPAYRCYGDEIFDSDPNTRTVWTGARSNAEGTQGFDVADAPLLAGVYGQRLCLSAYYNARYQDPVCVAQAPIFGNDPSTCPYIDHIQPTNVAGVILTVQQPALPAPAPTTDKTASPGGGNVVVLSKSVAVSRAKAALAKKFGKAYKRGKRKRLSCKVAAVEYSGRVVKSYRCAYGFRYRSKKRSGTVIVRSTSKGIKASVTTH